MKKVFLDELPKKSNGDTSWAKSIGKKVKFIYEEVEGYFEIIDYYNVHDTTYMIKIKYNGEIIDTYPLNLTKCTIAKIIKYKKQHNYLYNIGDNIKDNKRCITITGFKDKKVNRSDRKNETMYGYSFTCGNCGWDDGWISEKDLKYGYGCSCCHSKTVVKGINDIPTTAPWMVDYFQGGYEEASKYTKHSSTKIYPHCPHCGKVSNKKITISDIYSNHGFRCICSDKLSKIAKYIRTLLEQLKENNQIKEYHAEKRFDWCVFYSPFKNKNCIGIYDFVVEERKLIIETDGGFHRCDNLMSGQTVEESQFIDSEKDRLAIKNGYYIIRISDENDIKRDTIDKLKDIFNLDCINWEKCAIGSMSSLLLEACKIKNENPEMTTAEISSILNVGRTRMRRWLSYGAKNNLCIYDAKKEKEKSRFSKDHLASSEKRIICINNGMEFISGVDLSNKSEELFGQKFSTANISCCCNRKTHDINGYIFRFLNDLTDEERQQLNNNQNLIQLNEINNSIIQSFEKYMKQNCVDDINLLDLYKNRNKLLNDLQVS